MCKKKTSKILKYLQSDKAFINKMHMMMNSFWKLKDRVQHLKIQMIVWKTMVTILPGSRTKEKEVDSREKILRRKLKIQYPNNRSFIKQQ